MKPWSWIPQLASVAGLAMGCNALFGIEKPTLAEEERDGEGGAGGSSGDCEGDAECDSSPELCREEATRCSGLIFQTCGVDGDWEETEECEYLCDDDTGCYGECRPGAENCPSPTSRRTCDEEGRWSEPQACPQVCSAGKCEVGCIPEQVECLGRDLSVCRMDGTWRVDEECDHVCDGEDLRCTGECDPGTRDCNGLDLQECDARGEYQFVASCPGACIEDEGAVGGFRCADCLPDSEQCTDNVVEVCQDDGTWAPTDDCFETDETCILADDGAACGGDCAPDQVGCDGWDAVECTEGAWTPRENCSEPDAICRLGECEDNSPYNVGEADEEGWVSGAVVSGIQYLVPLTVSVRSELVWFRVRTFGGPGNVVMALYDDVDGQPGNLLVGSATFALIPALDTGETTNVTVLGPASTFILEPGEIYYVAAIFDSNVATLPRKAGPGWEGFGTYPIHPAVFSSFGEENNVYPFFLTVREQP